MEYQLSNGKTALIDSEDLPLLAGRTWYAFNQGGRTLDAETAKLTPAPPAPPA